jgi:hypothetical protein
MKCSKIQEWISLEMDDQLPPEHVADLQDHLESCDECRGFRDDLQVGLRMLHATDPELPDNFDWKLQLRLSQTLRETARDQQFPWQDTAPGWRRWTARAGVSAAVGLAAVLAVAMVAPGRFVTATDQGGSASLGTDQPLRLPIQTTASVDPVFDASRRPLDRVGSPFAGSTRPGLQQRVSTRSGLVDSRGFADSQWGGFRDADLLRLRQLEQELQAMRRQMQAKDWQIGMLQDRLDSLTAADVTTE